MTAIAEAGSRKSERDEPFLALALEIEDALFAARLNESELRMARLIVKLSLRLGRSTTPPLLQKDFGLLAGIGKTHVRETIGWLLGKKVIEIDRREAYRINPDPKTWLVNDRLMPEARARETELLRCQDQPEFFEHSAIRAGDHRVILDDATTEVAAARVGGGPNYGTDGQNVPNSGTRAIDEVTNSVTHRVPEFVTSTSEKLRISELAESPIGIGRASSSSITGTGTGNRPAGAGFLEDQIDRLQRTLGEGTNSYLGWWRKHAGKSRDHTNALRETLDNYSDCRGRVQEQMPCDRQRHAIAFLLSKT